MAQKEGGTEQGCVKSTDNLGGKASMAGVPTSGGGVVVEVREKKGSLRAAIPTMPFPVAVICLFLNTFIPGLGTFISAFTVLCGARSELISERGICCVFWLNVAAALIQILTAVIMVGWIMRLHFLTDVNPQLGTFISAFTVLCGARSELISERGICCVFWLNVAAALIQILTAVIMVGWIMSIFWGMDMVILAISDGYRDQGLPQDV